LISAVFSWALDEAIVEHNPVVALRKRVKEVARDRVLTDSEVKAWWNALDDSTTPRVAAVLRLLLLTGVRLSEACGMHREELQDDIWEITSERTKSGLAHVVPLSSTGLSIIAAVRGDTACVFPATDRGKVLDKPICRHTPDHAYAHLAVQLGMVDDNGKPNTSVHDLRRTMATNLAKLGVGEDLIDRIQGRVRRGGVGWIYNRHAYLAEKREALVQWEKHLLSVVG
jgi:integrase